MCPPAPATRQFGGIRSMPGPSTRDTCRDRIRRRSDGQARQARSARRNRQRPGASRRSAVGRKNRRSCRAACHAFSPLLAIAFPQTVWPPVPRKGYHAVAVFGEAGFDPAVIPLPCGFAAAYTAGRSRSSTSRHRRKGGRRAWSVGSRRPRPDASPPEVLPRHCTKAPGAAQSGADARVR